MYPAFGAIPDIDQSRSVPLCAATNTQWLTLRKNNFSGAVDDIVYALERTPTGVIVSSSTDFSKVRSGIVIGAYGTALFTLDNSPKATIFFDNHDFAGIGPIAAMTLCIRL